MMVFNHQLQETSNVPDIYTARLQDNLEIIIMHDEPHCVDLPMDDKQG